MQDWSQQVRKVVIYRIDSIYYGFLATFLIYNFNGLIKQFKHIFFWLGMALFFGIHISIFVFNVLPEQGKRIKKKLLFLV